jgi:hypothetical protein
MKAFATDPAATVVQAFRRAVKEAGGDDGVDMMRGWGDVEFVATDHRVPTIYFGPGTVAAAHTADEYIDLDRYHMGVAVYERAIPEFLGRRSRRTTSRAQEEVAMAIRTADVIMPGNDNAFETGRRGQISSIADLDESYGRCSRRMSRPPSLPSSETDCPS